MAVFILIIQFHQFRVQGIYSMANHIIMDIILIPVVKQLRSNTRMTHEKADNQTPGLLSQ